jgi:hypothetical protein
MTTDLVLVLDTLEHAIWTRRQAGVTDLSGLIHHTDAGSQGELNWSSQLWFLPNRGGLLYAASRSGANHTARQRKGSAGGRPPAHDPEIYKGRNVVERSFSLSKQWRGLATRYDKLAITYRAAAVLQACIRWLRLSGDTA